MDNKETIDSKTIEENFVKWSIPHPTRDYMVVVHCSTYNHGKYIEDALKSFVMQKTGFPFCAIVIDDGSTDNAPNIIRRYAENYPEIIKPILLGENHMQHGKSRNPYFDEWHNAAKYIAFCEGDDYWTDPLKLQKQVDFLEGHSDCCMCSHKVDWEIDGRLYKGGCQHENSCDLTTDEVIRNGGLYLATNSLVYRKGLDNDQPAWRKESLVGDYPMQILAALRGKIHFISDTMSVYRYCSSGSWTTQQLTVNDKREGKRASHARNKIMWMGLLDKETDFKYTKAIYSALFQDYIVLYNLKEIGFREYYHAAEKSGDNHFKRVFKDFLIRNFNLIYKVWKTLVD